LTLASHWLEDCANCTPTGEENEIEHKPLFVRHLPQANPFLSLQDYTPLVISGEGTHKNKQLKLLSKRKLAFTAINTLFSFCTSLELLNKYKNWHRPIFSPKRHQKPNLSQETVPLKKKGANNFFCPGISSFLETQNAIRLFIKLYYQRFSCIRPGKNI
jgi:hypothetical protein